MEIIFRFDDSRPEFYENQENVKLYAMQNAEILGFGYSKIFDWVRDLEKNQDRYTITTEEVRQKVIEILNDSGISLERLGY